MRRPSLVRSGLGLFLLTGACLGFLPAGASADAYGDAIARALRLLPRQPHKVVIVERADASSPTPRTEAYTYRGGRVVFLIRQGVTLQHALKNRPIFDCALAAIVWHEMAHLDGADEPAAELAEEKLWEEFIVWRRVESGIGMRYLALLKKRR